MGIAAAAILAATVSISAAPLRLAVAGDTGKGTDALAKGIRAVHARTPLDAIILTGDNFYPCGVTSAKDPLWRLVRPLTTVGVTIYPVLGNHDTCGSATAEAQVAATGVIPRWHFPSRQYAIETSVADFAFIDTTPYVRGRNDAAEEAVRALKSSKKPWQIVVGHHPLISSGYHGYFPRNEVAKMRELIPAIRDVGVDFYMCGHDHHLELIKGRMIHLVSGAGSDPIPPIKLRLGTVYPEEIRLERIGFAVVEIEAHELRVRFHDANGRAKSRWFRFAAPKAPLAARKPAQKRPAAN